MSRLKQNTSDLDTLIEKANALPDADTTITYETWEFEMEDGSIVIKEVAVQ